MDSATRTIRLSRGYIAVVDAEDYEPLKDLPWFAMVAHGRAYAAYKPGQSKHTFLMHRMVLNAQPGDRVFFVDDQTLNICKSNLILKPTKKKAA